MKKHILFLILFAFGLTISAEALENQETGKAGSTDMSQPAKPEALVEELYRRTSFEPGGSPDINALRQLVLPDAIVSFGTSPEEVEMMDLEGLLERLPREITEQGLVDFGLRQTPKSIRCQATKPRALCIVAVETEFVGTSSVPIPSTDIITLNKIGEQWLIATWLWAVKTPEDLHASKEPYQSLLSYPILLDDQQPEVKRQWDRALPFLAQKAVDLGFDLPNPYGVALIPYWQRMDLILSDLSISVGGGPMVSTDFIDFGVPEVENTAIQLKGDVWLFPFMNLYATLGKIDGKAKVPLTIHGEDLLPDQCSGAIQPPLCSETFSAEARPDFHGNNIAIGVNLAYGWKSFFFALPITYTWVDINIIDSTVNALVVSPRIGVSGFLSDWGAVSPYIGATYLDETLDLTGSVSFDTSGSGIPGVSDTTTIDYKIHQTNKDKWNYLVGFNWDVTKNWSVQAEGGFGGSRQNFISSGTFRF